MSVPFYYLKEEFEDTKGVIRIRKSKKDRQHNSQKKKNKRTNNDLQNTTQKTIRSSNTKYAFGLTLPHSCACTYISTGVYFIAISWFRNVMLDRRMDNKRTFKYWWSTITPLSTNKTKYNLSPQINLLYDSILGHVHF